MQYFTVGTEVCGLLRGSTIAKHDVLPYLEGKLSITTSAGDFSNVDFYNGSLFTTVPVGKFYLTCTTNTGRAYYIPAEQVEYSITIDKDDCIKRRINEGFNYSYVNPYCVRTVSFFTPMYDKETLEILLSIVKHSKVQFYDKDVSTSFLATLNSIPDINDFYGPSSVTLSVTLPKVVLSSTRSIILPCLYYNNYSVEHTSYVDDNNTKPYFIESFEILELTVTASSWNDYVSHTYYYNNKMYHLDNSISYSFAPDSQNQITLRLKSVNSVVSHINH